STARPISLSDVMSPAGVIFQTVGPPLVNQMLPSEPAVSHCGPLSPDDKKNSLAWPVTGASPPSASPEPASASLAASAAAPSPGPDASPMSVEASSGPAASAASPATSSAASPRPSAV